MLPLAIRERTAISALGAGLAAHRAALLGERGGLRCGRFETTGFDSWIGEVAGLDGVALPPPLAAWDCRNNRLALLALQQDGFGAAVERLKARHGAQRIGVWVGTSTAGIQQTELAYRARGADGALPDWFEYRRTHNCYSAADFVRELFGLQGPAAAIATACSSSAKVFACAARAIATGACDAAVVGGVDSLCLTTLYGFNALQLVSRDICRPADRERAGISIGEAAGFAILERPGAGGAGAGSRAGSGTGSAGEILLAGYGESSDAHHMSAPDPEGRGAAAAMRGALQRAGLSPADIGYINLHGTGTPANDLAEDRAVCALFGAATPCSSTKGFTGHTLGAAGILEALLCTVALQEGLLPRSLNTRERDPAFGGAVLLETRRAPLRHVLSNSFGFGGSNASLLLSAA